MALATSEGTSASERTRRGRVSATAKHGRRRSRAGLYEGDLPKAARQASFEQRVGLITEAMHDEVMVPLFLNRLMLRRQLAEIYAPLAFGYEHLPTELRKLAGAPRSQRDLDAAKRAASKRMNNLILNLRVLGFVEADVQRRSPGSIKNKALKLYGSGSVDAKALGPAADVIHLTYEGLRYFLSRHELCPPEELDNEAKRFYRATQVSSTRLAHALTAPAIYNELQLMAALGLIEIVEFSVERCLEPEVEAVEGPLDRSKDRRRRPIPRPDVFVCVAPKGRPELAETIYVEVDRGSQVTESQRKHPLPAVASPTMLIPRKLDNWFALALRLKRPLNLCFIVPEHGKISAKTRGAHLLGDLNMARRRWAPKLKTLSDEMRNPVRTLNHPLYGTEPTPRNFAVAIAELLAAKANPVEVVEDGANA